jgi:outer membrane protein insertion porin family
MKFVRRTRLFLATCLCAPMIFPLLAQQPAQQPQQQPAPQTPQQPRRPNPFETVPEAAPPPAQQQPAPQQPAPTPTPAAPPTQPPGQRPPLEAPAQPVAPVQPSGELVESVVFRGARRVPQDTLKALIATKAGDVYNEEALRSDLTILWNTGRFDDIRITSEQGRTGVIITFELTERRVVRSINYEGIHSVTVSEILDRFKERRVGLSTESQYDPNKVQRAAVVLKEFLAERGRQYATVDPVLEQIPPSTLKITFNVNEGPKVKVGKINIEGNQAFSDQQVIRTMKETKPIGIPYSIVLENLFAKTYDLEKLENDKERIRVAYQDKGYFQAKALDQEVSMRRTGGSGWRLPLIKPNKTGIYADINLPVEEGRLFHLAHMNFVGVKLFRTPETLMQPLFKMGPGDVFSTAKLRDGLKNMRDLYGQFGYIDFVPEPSFEFPTADTIDLTLTADEGKQFFVRRLDFSGNTTTRDKVIRREILLDEGDMFNTRLWDVSILRLNQLGYFEPLKKEEAAEIKRNPQSNTVDVTLKVKERGKNSIGLNGGVSGIAGSFLGFNYSTNNFLGLGETLSLESQLGTRVREVSLGFTEPYFLDRPVQLGTVVYVRRFSFDQGREASILAGQNLIPLYNSLGQSNLLNYIQNGHGFSVSSSYQLRRSFARVGITYAYDSSSIVTQTAASANYFQYINFNGVSGPNALSGIKTSHITPSYSYNTVNQAINPTGGRSTFLSVDWAGSILGGNVNTVRPAVDLKYFKPAPWHKTHILAFHTSASMITGYGGKDAPPFARSFIGGEQDVRGFEIWGISPIAFIPSSATVTVLNDDGTHRQQKTYTNGVATLSDVTMTIPTYQVITPGGDTQAIGNFEYRIPIFGPVNLALFADGGINKILLTNQLKLTPSRTDDLNNQFPQAAFDGRVKIAPGTQKFRASTGVELQVMLPVVQAPFRIYWAYNPSVVREYIQPPIVFDRSYFPNAATFNSAIVSNGNSFGFFEKRTLFRFTVGRTF